VTLTFFATVVIIINIGYLEALGCLVLIIARREFYGAKGKKWQLYEHLDVIFLCFADRTS
jgi:hypothetical protein